MAYYKSKKTMLYILLFVFACAIIFLSLSIYFSHIHANSVVTEWQNWFGIAKQANDAENLPVVASSLSLLTI